MIENALYNLLKNNADVAALAGSRIYPAIAPEDTDAAYIVYQCISAPRDHTLTGSSSLVQARFQLSCWSGTHDGVKSLKDAVRSALDNFSDTEPVTSIDIQCIHFEDEGDLFDFNAGVDSSKKYGKRIDIKISFIE